jgi:glycosyltransferase involved in cell wall biosynthesis
MGNSPSTWLVVPCYNEADRLDVPAFSRFLKDFPDAGLVFVDDGSRDDTSRVCREVADQPPSGKALVLSLDENRGKAAAVRAGVLHCLEACSPQCIGYWDADLSTPLPEVAAFERTLEVHPPVVAVFGARVKRLGANVERRADRHYLGRVFATVVSSGLLRLPVYDTQCGAKLFRADAARAVFAEPFVTDWCFDVEILVRLMLRYGEGVYEAVYELPLTAWRHVPGSKLKPRHFLLALAELYRLRRAYGRMPVTPRRA